MMTSHPFHRRKATVAVNGLNALKFIFLSGIFLFPDISSTKLSLRIDQPFTVSLFNTKSRDYLLLKDQVTQIVRVLLGFSLYFVFGDLCIYHKAP